MKEEIHNASASRDGARWGIDFGFTLADATRIFRRVFNMRVEHLGITGPQWRIIAYLMRRDGMKQVEIADEIELDKAAVGRTIERLEALNLVRREECADDGRARRVYLNSSALDLGSEILKEARIYYDDVLDCLAPAERAEFLRTLSKVRKRLIALDEDIRSRRAVPNRRAPAMVGCTVAS